MKQIGSELEAILNDTMIALEIEKAEDIRVKLAARWRRYMKQSFVVLCILMVVNIAKILLMIVSYRIIYRSICPFFSNLTDVIIENHRVFMAKDENVCENTFSTSLISDVLIFSLLFMTYGFAAKYFERLLLKVQGPISYQNSNVTFCEEDCETPNRGSIPNFYLWFSGYVVKHIWEITGVFICNLYLLCASSFSFSWGFKDWVENCEKVTSKKKIIVFTIFDGTTLSYYEAENVDLDSVRCKDPLLILIALLSYAQISLYILLLVLVAINKSLKSSTYEFEDLLFRLKPYLFSKFFYHRTYIKYLFDNKPIRLKYSVTDSTNVQSSRTGTS